VLAREIRVQLLDLAARRGSPRLLPPDRSPAPPPEPTMPVARRYLHLAGPHEAHPGTGRGYAARARTTQDVPPIMAISSATPITSSS
jgi:DNA (cytosine-5)-methyltransferase 1